MANSRASFASDIADLGARLTDLERGSQIAYSTIAVEGQGDLRIPDAIQQGTDAAAAIPALEEGVSSAVSDATAAVQSAAAAILQADAADAAASDAASAAAAANAAAADAAGLAGTKGLVIFQVSPPTGSRAVPANLWINTTNGANTPNRYDVDQAKWIPVTDKAATDAASAAAAAQSTATDAASVAATAKSTADSAKATADSAASAATAAQSTADGKNTVTYSANAPTAATPGKTTGDVWFVRAVSTGIVTGQYEWTAAKAWEQRTLGSAVIASLDAGKITTGQLSADRIDVQTFTGKTIVGAVIKTAASGQRAELINNGLTFYSPQGLTAGSIFGTDNGASGGVIRIGSGSGATTFGSSSLPVAGTVDLLARSAWVPELYATSIYDASTNLLRTSTWAGTRSQTGVGRASRSRIGAFAANPAETIDGSFLTMRGTGFFDLKPGQYIVSATMTIMGGSSVKATGRTFIELSDETDASNKIARALITDNVAEDAVTLTAPVAVQSSGRALAWHVFVTTGATTADLGFTMTVTRIG